MPRLKRQKEGYLLIDHKDSPGVPEELIRAAIAAGKPAAPAVRSGQTYESATITCCHCNRVVILNPDRKRARGYCAKCDHYVCDLPACNLECNPFQRLLDDLHHQAASYGGIFPSAPFAGFTSF